MAREDQPQPERSLCHSAGVIFCNSLLGDDSGPLPIHLPPRVCCLPRGVCPRRSPIRIPTVTAFANATGARTRSSLCTTAGGMFLSR